MQNDIHGAVDYYNWIEPNSNIRYGTYEENEVAAGFQDLSLL